MIKHVQSLLALGCLGGLGNPGLCKDRRDAVAVHAAELPEGALKVAVDGVLAAFEPFCSSDTRGTNPSLRDLERLRKAAHAVKGAA